MENSQLYDAALEAVANYAPSDASQTTRILAALAICARVLSYSQVLDEPLPISVLLHDIFPSPEIALPSVIDAEELGLAHSLASQVIRDVNAGRAREIELGEAR